MFRKIGLWFKKIIAKLSNFFLRCYKTLFKFAAIMLIVAAAWYGFIYLVGKPPIDTTPALIMVWLSVLIIFLALFPKILDRVKRLKIKDFEIELEESVKKAAVEEDFISMDEFDDYVFSQKGDFRNLNQILRDARRFPEKQILLTVNLRDGRYISIPMLFIYLFFMDLIGNPVNILFVSSRRHIKYFSDITNNTILGIVSGKKAIKIFYDRFPWLMRIFEFGRFSDMRIDKFIHRGFKGFPYENFFYDCYRHLRENRNNENEYLTEEDVISWFGNDLDSKIVDLDNIELNNQLIKNAIEQGDEFLLIVKNGVFKSAIAVCKVTRNVSSKVLASIVK